MHRCIIRNLWTSFSIIYRNDSEIGRPLTYIYVLHCHAVVHNHETWCMKPKLNTEYILEHNVGS